MKSNTIEESAKSMSKKEFTAQKYIFQKPVDFFLQYSFYCVSLATVFHINKSRK